MSAHRAVALLAGVVAMGLAATAAARSGPNDIDFMGTRTQGGIRCETFKPPLRGSYCPAGAATFIAHGDILFACDYRADHRSVAVRARYRGQRAWHLVGVNDHGSERFNGCRTEDRDFRENRSVQFQVCLAAGRPIRVLEKTCGAISEAFNASET